MRDHTEISTAAVELRRRVGINSQQPRELSLAALAARLRLQGREGGTPTPSMDNLRLSSHQFPEVYKDLGINIAELGCVMLDIEPLAIVAHVPDGENDLYYSENPVTSYAAGAVGEENPHITLLYGLDKSAEAYRPQIDRVLKGWSPDDVIVAEVSYFNSPIDKEPYYCIVAKLQPTTNLLEGNARLRLLPHISTFPTYKPHATLAYIKKDETTRDKWIRYLTTQYTGQHIAVKSSLRYD